MDSVESSSKMSAEEQSNALRSQGNTFYKNMKLTQAIKNYSEAAKLTPKSPLPFRNLSAAAFEAGKYRSCRVMAEKAIKLEEGAGGEDKDVQIGKLRARIGKAERFEKMESKEEKEVRRRVTERIGKYKASLLENHVYFNIGHDAVLSIFDEAIQLGRPDDENVSFFFGGIGDARNLFYTLIHISELEISSKVPKKTYHFLINDHSINVLARDLIMISLIDELSKKTPESDDAIHVLNTIFFVYNAVMMPRCAFTHLQAVIQKLLETLRRHHQPLPWVFIHDSDRRKLISALESWSGPAKTYTSSSEIIRKVVVHKFAQRGPSNFTPPECEDEETLYNGAAVLYPPQIIQEKHDPGFSELVATVPASIGNASKYRAHLEKHWDFNVTLIDSSLGRRTKLHFDLGHDPFQMAPCLDYSETHEPVPGRKILYDHIAPFFVELSKAIKHLEGRFQIEAVLGDCTDVCEAIRYGLYEPVAEKDNETSGDTESLELDKSKKTTSWLLRPKNFPDKFDRAHLSNVPDYIGGHLSTFLYVAPILKNSPLSYLTANCLRNSGSFDSIEDYLSEYQLITTEKMLDQLCQITIMDRGQGSMWPMACFTYYRLSSPRPHPFENLLPKEPFQKWFYALFFRLALPMTNDMWDVTRIIFSPLNLSVIPRLVSRLVEVGYPAHWLAECLQNILTNNVVTTSRPPRKLPLRAADIDKKHSLRKLDTSPFITEMRMVLAAFSPLLPFSVTSSPLSLPNLSNIYRYSFHLSGFDPESPDGHDEKTNCIALFIWDQRLFQSTKNATSFIDCIQPLLDSSYEELDPKFKDATADKLRSKALFLFTTVEWDVQRKVASVWMEKSLVDKLDVNYWLTALVRTDTWSPIVSSVSMVVDVVSRGEAWS